MTEIGKEVVHLARLALAGAEDDIRLYVRRLERKWRGRSPEVAGGLAALSQHEGGSVRSILRRSLPAREMPVDMDSRLELARYEASVSVSIRPTWNGSINASLRQVLAERDHEAELLEAGLTPTRSLLFTGPPGVGKSLAARWLAAQTERPLVTLDLSAVMSSFLGRTGNNLRQVLDFAKATPCVLLLDEFDAIAKRRDDTAEVGELKRLVTVLLQEIDEWPASGLLVAATNHSDLLDPAVWRRFDMVVSFPLPDDARVRDAIATHLADDEAAIALLDVATIAFRGASFSDIARTIKQARRQGIVASEPASSALAEAIRARLTRLSVAERKAAGAALVDLGMSQHKIREWTGLSRDTIRKNHRGGG